MFPIVDVMQCQNLAVSSDVMQHVVKVESSFNPYAIGVVGGKLVRQPKSLEEAVATAEMLESRGYNFSVGLAQVNRYNLAKYGLTSYRQAFDGCSNLRAGSKILAECHGRAGGDWGSAFSCYYSGNFVTGFQHGYVQKVFASIGSSQSRANRAAISLPPGSAGNVRDDLAAMPARLPDIFPTGMQGETMALSNDPLWAGSKTFQQSGIKAPQGSTEPISAQKGAQQRSPPMVGNALSEGIVQLTRSGPVYPGQKARVSVGGSEKDLPESSASGPPAQVKVDAGDTAFVF